MPSSYAGNVFGPAMATDNAVARFDSTTGKLLQNSVVLIGDTGVITGAETIDLTSTNAQVSVKYDGTKRGAFAVNSSGTLVITNLDNYDLKFALPDASYFMRLSDNRMLFSWPNGAFTIQIDNGGGFAANISRYCLTSNPASGPGIGDGGAADTLSLLAGGGDRVLITSSLFKLVSGMGLQLGNAYVNTPSVSTGYVLITDSTGTVYEIPAKAH